MPTPETRLAGNSASHQRMKDRGWRRLTIWLPPAAVALLAAFTPRYGSATKAVEAGLKALQED
jgi:hypothetical protein